MTPLIRIDLESVISSGQTYEDRYGGYLKVFKQIAYIPPGTKVIVKNAPWSWYPLLYHLNCIQESSVMVFDHCQFVRDSIANSTSLDRTAVEVLCGFRPETVDALWKCDMQWRIPYGRVRDYPKQQEFIITTNGSFYRNEVKSYYEKFREYKPLKNRVLLVPCAADKPYPSPLHKRILSFIPTDYYLMNATGVLGLVPQDLWSIMPWYDSGVPNQWRLYRITKEYFSKHHHDRIVVYCDFYSYVLYDAFSSIGQLDKVDFVLPLHQYEDYIDLLRYDRLEELKLALVRDNPYSRNLAGA